MMSHAGQLGVTFARCVAMKPNVIIWSLKNIMEYNDRHYYITLNLIESLLALNTPRLQLVTLLFELVTWPSRRRTKRLLTYEQTWFSLFATNPSAFESLPTLLGFCLKFTRPSPSQDVQTNKHTHARMLTYADRWRVLLTKLCVRRMILCIQRILCSRRLDGRTCGTGMVLEPGNYPCDVMRVLLSDSGWEGRKQGTWKTSHGNEHACAGHARGWCCSELWKWRLE